VHPYQAFFLLFLVQSLLDALGQKGILRPHPRDTGFVVRCPHLISHANGVSLLEEKESFQDDTESLPVLSAEIGHNVGIMTTDDVILGHDGYTVVLW
jgi:hypothetical protein